ncbi:MAG TPA: hypothetical protein VH913_17370 [Hyphomicrobiaceae bacterium]|jgi:hypothetical protein
MGRPIGVWIATAYLLVLLALAVFWTLSLSMRSGSLFVLLSLLSAILLPLLNRWAVLATAALAVGQGGSYLMTVLSRVPVPRDTASTVTFSVQYNFAPLVFLAATVAVALYTVWLWRAGALR